MNTWSHVKVTRAIGLLLTQALLFLGSSWTVVMPVAAQSNEGLAEATQQNTRTISYTAPDGRVVTLLAQADTDGDGIENELELNGYSFDVASGALLPCQGSLTECFFTDPLQASTDQDPYSDFMEATGANMDQSVEAPYNHPLVAAEPVIVVRLLSYDVFPIEEITDTEGRSQSTEFSTSFTIQTETGSSLAVTGTVEGGFSLTEGFSIGGSGSVSEEEFHSRSEALTTGTSEGMEINWSTARTTRPNEAAGLRLHVEIENQGYAPAFDVVPSFSLKLNGKVIATVTPDVPPDLTLTPGDVSAELVIEQDDLGNEITLTLDELKAIQLGAPLTLELVVESATVAWWNPETNAATDRIPWSTFRPGIEAVTTVLQARVGEVPYTFKVYAGNQDGSIRYTLRELLSLVFDVEEQNGATVIANRRYPDDWYMTTTSDDLIEAWEGAGRPDILNLDMVRDTRLHMLSPGTDPGPAIDFASFSPDMKQVFVIASPRGGFPVVSVQVALTIAGETREVELVREAGSAFYTNAVPFEARPESVGIVTVTDARSDVTSKDVLFPFATLDEDCAEVTPRPPVNGEYLVLLDGSRPAMVYCRFYDENGSPLDDPLTSFWLPRNTDPTTTNRLDGLFFTDATTGFAVGSDGIFRTIDGGQTWAASGTTVDLSEVDLAHVSFMDTAVGIAVGGTGGAGTILRTSDGGNTWEEAQIVTAGAFFLNGVAFADANVGVAVGSVFDADNTSDPVDGTILRTSDGGESWTRLSDDAFDAPEILEDVSFTDTGLGVVVGFGGTLLQSTDGGATWSAQASGTTEDLVDVFFVNTETGLIVGDNGTVLRTDDGGQTWPSQASSTSTDLKGVFFTDAHTGVVAGSDGTLLRTNDGGQTWTPQESGVDNTLRAVWFTDPNTGFVVGSSGTILQTTSAGGDPVVITAMEEAGNPVAELPERIRLEQNYPNPFNPATTIRYTLRTQQHVTLTVYDLLGRQVATLVDGRQAPGTHNVRFEAHGLASGLYFYRLDASGVRETRKMVLRR